MLNEDQTRFAIIASNPLGEALIEVLKRITKSLLESSINKLFVG